MVMDLELEVWGRHQRRDPDELPEGSVNVRGCRGETSYQFGSYWLRDRSQDFLDRDLASLE